MPVTGKYGGCGEVVNTADCGSVTRGFESHHSPHFFCLKSDIVGLYGGIAKR